MHFRVSAAFFLLVFTIATAAQMPDRPLPRPKITGISHISVYTSNPAAADHYYRGIVGAVKVFDPENPKGIRYAVNSTQFIEVLPLPAEAGANRLDHIAWKTDDAEKMRRYLYARSWKTPSQVEKGGDGSLWFRVKDPEGNMVEFVQPPYEPKPVMAPAVIGRHIIHVGLLVHSRAFENTFYRDLLGFRPYWFGGKTDGQIDWVSLQTPESHDWLDFMLVSDPPSADGQKTELSQQELGVLDHFSIGVASVDAAYLRLETDGKLSGAHDAHTHIGRDGKGQFNLYDPDGTRLELMDFHASEKPCCSPFTADDPAE